ncbi:MAG TPA: phosphomannomutase/phosphoglucomutase, partial [Candidatus Parcubacteria bacterium]|nr:phosphomannomutase/phosphoglucomutase [Candidatus Parcubacteria bacterium]
SKKLSPYFNLPEINFVVEDKKKILEEVGREFSDGKCDYLDGVTVEYEDWWFNLRPSQTEPLLRLTMEAEKEGLLESKKERLVSFVESLGGRVKN